MGKARDWQSELSQALRDIEGLVVLNPRRDDWDDCWLQSIDNPQFHEQVSWELSGLEKATTVAFYFIPGTKSPITLLELGLFAASGKCVVFCPEGYWRKGNVDIVCQRYGVKTVNCWEELLGELRKRLG